MSRTELKLAVAGTGAMADYHAYRFRQFPELRLIACYDRCAERAREFARRHEIPRYYTSIGTLLRREAPHAVSVAVADPEHYDVGRAVLSSDAALFMEKPLTARVEEAVELLHNGALSKRAHLRAPGVCNFSKLNYPAIYGATHLLHYGALGSLRHLRLSYLQSWIVSTVWGEWWRNPRWLWRISSSHGGGGALRDLGSHLFYLAGLLLGQGDVERASTTCVASREQAAGSGWSCDKNDTFECELVYPHGARAVVEGSYAAAENINNVVLSADCERGRVEVNLEQSKTDVFVTHSSGTRRRYRCAKVFSTYQEFLRLVRAKAETEPVAACTAPHSYADTYESLRSRIGVPSLVDGLNVQQMIAAADARAGGE